MGYSRVILLSIILAFTLCCSTEAYNFIVGGKNGWSLHPSENYSQWSARLRFSVNDTLSFKYTKGTDSVVVVSKEDYDKCNAANPISKLDGGDSVFKFDRSGPFYFITGNKTNCDQGQKLIIVVLAIRNKSPPTPSVPAPASPPASQAPVPSPETQVPSPSPSSDVPTASPAPVPSGPAVSPAPGPSGPTASPSPATSGPAGSPAPVTSGPAANAPGTVVTPSPLSPGNTPADISSPPGPSKSFAPAASPAVLLSVCVVAFIAFF